MRVVYSVCVCVLYKAKSLDHSKTLPDVCIQCHLCSGSETERDIKGKGSESKYKPNT